MFKLLLKILVLPPELLKVHAKGYADLASQAWAEHWCRLKNRWLMYALSVLSLTLALIFGGVALLLWSALPFIDARHAWILPALPLVFVVMGIACWLWARSHRTRPMFNDIKEQIQLDIRALQEVQAS